jgi:carbonic anhydrase
MDGMGSEGAGPRMTPQLEPLLPGRAVGAGSVVPGNGARPASPAAHSNSQLQAPDLARRTVVRTAGLAGLVAVGLAGAGSSGAACASTDEAAGQAPGPHAALRILMDGNLRWARGRARHPRQSVRQRERLARHQSPFATVISCIDSRVPPELVFDAGLGDFFAIRTGAQTLDTQVVLGSIEFGPVNYPTAKLMVVLGHQDCGAVSAAIKVIEHRGRAPGHIRAVVDALRPAYRLAKPQPGDLLDNMIRAQTRLTVQRLRRDPVLRKLDLLIVGGRYDMDSGLVEIIA